MNQPQGILLVGRLLIDCYYLLKEYPQHGQDAIITDSFERIGGCTYNAAATIKNLGGDPLILSPLCADQRGQWIQSALQTLGFMPDLMYPMEGETEYCVVLLDESGERTFLTYSGSQFLLSDEILRAAIQTRPAFTHLTGYSLIEPENTGRILRLLKELKDAGSKIFFDPSPLVKEIDRVDLKSMLDLTDILCLNRAELVAIQTHLKLPSGMTSTKNLRDGKMIVVKEGEHGATVYMRDEQFSIPAYPVHVVDGTGAGDSFGAGFLYALSEGMSTQFAVHMGAACGALTAGQLGPQVNFSRADIDQLIKKDLE